MRLVEASPARSGLRRDGGHAAGSRDVSERRGDDARIAVFQGRLQAGHDVIEILETGRGIPGHPGAASSPLPHLRGFANCREPPVRTVCAAGAISGVTSWNDVDSAPPPSTALGVTLDADAEGRRQAMVRGRCEVEPTVRIGSRGLILEPGGLAPPPRLTTGSASCLGTRLKIRVRHPRSSPRGSRWTPVVHLRSLRLAQCLRAVQTVLTGGSRIVDRSSPFTGSCARPSALSLS